MARNEDIINEIYNLLNSAKTGSLNYIKNILKGVKDFDIEIENALPAIIIEPMRDDEEQATIPFRKRIFFEVNIFCLMKVYDYNNQLTGGEGTKGIMDMITDVKNVLNANRTLNGKVLKFNFLTTDYSMEDFPLREAVITMQCDYIIEDTQR